MSSLKKRLGTCRLARGPVLFLQTAAEQKQPLQLDEKAQAQTGRDHHDRHMNVFTLVMTQEHRGRKSLLSCFGCGERDFPHVPKLCMTMVPKSGQVNEAPKGEAPIEMPGPRPEPEVTQHLCS